MATKATKLKPDSLVALAIESDELHQPEIDAFIVRNREVLNESIRRSLEEYERGEYDSRTIEQIIADGKERFRRGQ